MTVMMMTIVPLFIAYEICRYNSFCWCCGRCSLDGVGKLLAFAALVLCLKRKQLLTRTSDDSCYLFLTKQCS
uniref:Uncharacterized protein n=1 Tax=Rhizophora mucronata TaxID=61149 RepID=A0A2P2QZL8_RHIMU